MKSLAVALVIVVFLPHLAFAQAPKVIKTDKVDAHTLAQLLRADYLPAVEMPDEATWARRQLVSHRQLLVEHQRSLKNTIHAVFNRLLLPRPEGGASRPRASSRPTSGSSPG